MSEETTNYSDKVENLYEEITGLSVLELNDLRKAMEDRLGVTAAAPVAVAAGPGGGGEEEEEKDSFDVVLTGFGDKKIAVIKAVREITGLGLKEAKEMVESAPKAIKEGVPTEDAEKLKAQIEEAGGSVELK